MGYRSEVKIVTTSEGYKRLCERVDELSMGAEESQLIGTKIKPEFFEDYDGAIVFGWDFIKWYDDIYDDVINIVTALRELEEDGVPYEFCRVGENWDDVEFDNCDPNGKLTVSIEPVTTIAIYR